LSWFQMVAFIGMNNNVGNIYTMENCTAKERRNHFDKQATKWVNLIECGVIPTSVVFDTTF